MEFPNFGPKAYSRLVSKSHEVESFEPGNGVEREDNEDGLTRYVGNRDDGSRIKVGSSGDLVENPHTETAEPTRRKYKGSNLRNQPTIKNVVGEDVPESSVRHQLIKASLLGSHALHRSASDSTSLSPAESSTIAFVNGNKKRVFKDRIRHLETGANQGLSHLQVTDTTHDKQIINQLLTGMLGTGLGMMQGMGTGGMVGGTPAATPVAAAPVAVSPLLPGSGPTIDMAASYSDRSGLSTFELILICSGALLAVGLVGLLFWLVMSRKRKRHR